MTAPMPQLQQMQLRNVPTGHLFSFDMQAIYKLTAKAGMGPQVVLHAVPLDPAGGHGDMFVIDQPGHLDATVSVMPDPAGNSAVAPPATLPLAPPVPAQTIGSSNLATAVQEAAASAAIQSAFPAAAPVPASTAAGILGDGHRKATAPTATDDSPAFLRTRSGPLQEAVALFSGWITWPENERTTGQRFQLAAYNLAEGPDSLATVRALLALHAAREYARGFVPVMSPF